MEGHLSPGHQLSRAPSSPKRTSVGCYPFMAEDRALSKISLARCPARELASSPPAVTKPPTVPRRNPTCALIHSKLDGTT